ncbi:hypothetical protein KIN20_007893 [Parelaphostrongylus tenuis]|uniref:Uncharacterized protein n=1 Tax=Parelaphostrongylus tenuis TaxID=148309 RepID=A0AAD5MN24_PARTN|nr:hypothetical protein KIN20_007893 [Parelaphostrongylus tenuis]
MNIYQLVLSSEASVLVPEMKRKQSSLDVVQLISEQIRLLGTNVCWVKMNGGK